MNTVMQLSQAGGPHADFKIQLVCSKWQKREYLFEQVII